MFEVHFEEFLHLAGLGHDKALIAWGGFYFRVRSRRNGDEWKLVDDSDLDHVHPPRRESVGARSEPFGALPTAVRAAETMTASFISCPASGLR